MNDDEEQGKGPKSKKFMKEKGKVAKLLSKKVESRNLDEKFCPVDFDPSDVEDSPDEDAWIDYERNREKRIRKSVKRKKIGNDPHSQKSDK